MKTANIYNMNEVIPSHDLLFITLDTLRFDVADRMVRDGSLPVLKKALNGEYFEQRHSPASFTYAAHQAFFAGFLPTPAAPGLHPRLFALAFEGSTTTDASSYVFDAPDIVHGLQSVGYHTICIGGVGFFNKKNALGSVLPSMFDESHWSPELGVRSACSTEKQVQLGCERLASFAPTQRIFLFLNVSAIHQPSCIFLEGETQDSLVTHAAALSYVDKHLAPLFEAFKSRSPTFAIVCSDHGTAFGEDGYHGHRLAHPSVWNVPYAHFFL